MSFSLFNKTAADEKRPNIEFATFICTDCQPEEEDEEIERKRQTTFFVPLIHRQSPPLNISALLRSG